MINKNKIQSLISENYNIFVTQVDKIRDGSADLFIIDKKFVLKMYQKNFDLKRILKSIDICDYLYNLGYNVPKYYKTLINKYYFIYNGCYGILMSFLNGTKLNAFAADINQIIDSAKFYAKLECDLQNYKKLLPDYDFCKYGTENISETLSKINILISKTNDESIVNDLKTRIKFLNELDIEFFSDISKITICNCHGDYYVSQCLYNRRKIKSILDFESAKKMPIIIEIIRSYIYLDYNFDINNFILYVKEINKIFPLNYYDFKYMPYLYYLKLLRSTFGYEQYINNHTKKNEYLLLGRKMQNQILFLHNYNEIISYNMLQLYNNINMF